MLLLKKKTFSVESSSARVTGDEVQTIATASDIIAAAEAEAARIIADSKNAYENEKKRGYEDGQSAARAEELNHKLDLVNESVAFMERIETKMGDLVVKALKKCVMEIGDKELVYQVVRKSMQAIVRTQRQIKIKVSPDMVDVVKARIQEILTNFPSVAFADVVEDSHLSDTACIVETDAGSVEASINGQLEAIEKSIRRHFSKE